MGGRRNAFRRGVGQQIQRAEQEAAKRRILALAEAGQMEPEQASGRVMYDAFLLAVALTLARRHRPVWSWRRWRRVCRCGADLPCHVRHRLPIGRGHWPGGETR
ncbi:hypothetical protein GA0074704_3116 [Micromonospora siamensis]|uniref:Uncharacterized protein n=1 Tax=Micromonospora siamensis TaxID=299152 RepID=A0A1C5I971_9ACTN|nr:hypothetical protein GA0074704_3116 [Micromonospora siamensis]